MTRGELLRLLILEDVCDDYEEIEHITGSVTVLAQKCGINVTRDEIVQELMNPIDAALVKAYRLFSSRRPAEAFDGRPPLTELEESGGYTYFLITENGMKVHLANDHRWRFDQTNLLGRDWISPE